MPDSQTCIYMYNCSVIIVNVNFLPLSPFLTKPGMVARSDAHLPGLRTVADLILTSGSILLWILVMKKMYFR